MEDESDEGYDNETDSHDESIQEENFEDQEEIIQHQVYFD